MFSSVQNWFAPPAYPVGIDFGTHCLRMAQVDRIDGEFHLIAAASVVIPLQVRDDPEVRLKFFSESLRQQWRRGNFRGHRAVLAIPSAYLHLQNVRVPRLNGDPLQQAILKEAQDKLPLRTSEMLLRHVVAGDVYQDQEPRSEIVMMAAGRQWVDDFLGSAFRAGIDVVGLRIEPQALIDCFLNIYRRKSDLDVTSCFVDIGSSGSRAVIARGKHLRFARKIPVGGEDFSRAVATEFSLTRPEAEALRIRACAESDELTGDRRSLSISNSSREDHADPIHSDQPLATAERMKAAIGEPLSKLVEELELCRLYHETAFPQHRIQRLIFVGGEAGNRDLCRAIASKLSLPAHIGDPLVRMGRTTRVGTESGIDRCTPQPAWAVAVGLSMGAARDPNSPSENSAGQHPVFRSKRQGSDALVEAKN